MNHAGLLSTLRTLGAALLLILWARCQEPAAAGTFWRVLLEDVPSGADRAVVYTLLNGAQANEILTIKLNGQSSFSFGLRLRDVAAGQAVTSVAVVDEAGCLLATASGPLTISPADTLLGLSLKMRPLAGAPLCAAGRAALTAVEPTQISTAHRSRDGQKVPLRLRGWGFRPGMTVVIGGQVQPPAVVLSAEECVISEPLTALPPGPVRVAVMIPDQPEVAREDLLSIFIEPVALRLIQTGASAPTDALLDVGSGDLNGDALPDLALLDVRGNVSVYHNLGKRRLALAQKFPSSLIGLDAASVGSMAIADVTGDGTADLVLTSTVGTVLITRQMDGTYAALRQVPELKARDLALADLDGDKQLDLILAADEISVIKNPGGGLFGSVATSKLTLTAESVQVADLNGDSRPDLVVATASGDVHVIQNEASGLRSVMRFPVRVGCPDWPPRVLLADLDSDGALDIITNGSSALLLSRSGSFTPRYLSGVAPCFGGIGLAASDFNADGVQDALWILGSSTLVLPGVPGGNVDGQSLFSISIPSVSTAFAASGPRHTPLIDLDGDGFKEVAIGVNVLGLAAPL